MTRWERFWVVVTLVLAFAWVAFGLVHGQDMKRDRLSEGSGIIPPLTIEKGQNR